MYAWESYGFGLGLIVVLIHISRVILEVHIHRWIRLLPAASLVYGRNAARADTPGRGHVRGVAVCGVGIVFRASASCGVHGDS